MKTFLSLLALFFLFAYSNSLRVPQRSILKTNSQDVDRRSLPVSSTKLHSTSTATSVSMQPSVKKTASAFSNAIFQSAPLQYLLGSAALKTDMINFAKTIFSPQLFLFIFFQLSYSRNFKFAHRLQILAWTLLKLGTPLEFDKSILGFMSERAELLAKLMGFNYALTIACFCLSSLGVRVRGDFPVIFAKLTYVLYFTNFLDLFKAKFLYIFAPKLAESKRQSYVVNRAASVGIWTVGVLISCEMISTYLKIPLTSILAFGGVGGLAIGLSARDIVANFLGGMLLLFNEPFTPGDMITLKVNNMDITGRVERIGWGQIRLRGNTTRPTYIPNSHFVQVPVTNMDRITHRKFETRIPLRIQDFSLVPEITARIKDSLRAVPKLDVLSMPFRVSLVEVNQYRFVNML